ncbi:hypothetical protein [uncultured Clostridium sp.]|uniref:hypothetical protein n=1 Tax=uncultured Clostridium sp. TaxID=59620 RepID=UPI00261FBB38|nr:hypothetical protein [uncultured Clostridium sp.]
MEKELEEIFEKHKEELLELDTQRLEETFDLVMRIVKREQENKLLIRSLKDRYKFLEKEQSKLEEKYRNYSLCGTDFDAGREIGRIEGKKREVSILIDKLMKGNNNES